MGAGRTTMSRNLDVLRAWVGSLDLSLFTFLHLIA
jgi:hypothetical protein